MVRQADFTVQLSPELEVDIKDMAVHKVLDSIDTLIGMNTEHSAGFCRITEASHNQFGSTRFVWSLQATIQAGPLIFLSCCAAYPIKAKEPGQSSLRRDVCIHPRLVFSQTQLEAAEQGLGQWASLACPRKDKGRKGNWQLNEWQRSQW